MADNVESRIRYWFGYYRTRELIEERVYNLLELSNHTHMLNTSKFAECLQLLLKLINNGLFVEDDMKFYVLALDYSVGIRFENEIQDIKAYVNEKINERNKQIFDGVHDYLIDDLTKIAIEYL